LDCPGEVRSGNQRSLGGIEWASRSWGRSPSVFRSGSCGRHTRESKPIRERRGWTGARSRTSRRVWVITSTRYGIGWRSGGSFPPPVLAVEIPKPHGGVRILGVPTVADRVAQTVVAMELEKRVEPMFHPDSYGYRPRRSALDAVGTCRKRCWEYDWVVELDIQ